MNQNTKYYFASDFHLGTPDYQTSLIREKKIVRWLDSIKHDAAAIFLLGDLFDFWFEYKHAVPKGYTRFLGKLAELSDAGIEIVVFTGNHDLWMRDYFTEEFKIAVHHKPIFRELAGKQFMLGHGDGLGPGDKSFKVMKKIFVHPLSKWLYRQLHPDIGIRIAFYFSRRSRLAQNPEETMQFLGEDREWLILYAKKVLENENIDYFVFGHRHYPLTIKLNEESTYINLGDWLNFDTYAVFDGKQMELKAFDKPVADYHIPATAGTK